MKDRIRNILFEALILESPLFRAVGIKYDDYVYEGEPWMTHGDLILDVFCDEIENESENEDEDNTEFGNAFKFADSIGVVEGFISMDGKFVSRDEAKQMVSDAESFAMRFSGELMDVVA